MMLMIFVVLVCIVVYFLLRSEFGLKELKSFSSCRNEFIHSVESYVSHLYQIEFLSGHTIL